MKTDNWSRGEKRFLPGLAKKGTLLRGEIIEPDARLKGDKRGKMEETAIEE